jgi:hypothetical protein
VIPARYLQNTKQVPNRVALMCQNDLFEAVIQCAQRSDSTESEGPASCFHVMRRTQQDPLHKVSAETGSAEGQITVIMFRVKLLSRLTTLGKDPSVKFCDIYRNPAPLFLPSVYVKCARAYV